VLDRQKLLFIEVDDRTSDERSIDKEEEFNTTEKPADGTAVRSNIRQCIETLVFKVGLNNTQNE